MSVKLAVAKQRTYECFQSSIFPGKNLGHSEQIQDKNHSLTNFEDILSSKWVEILAVASIYCVCELVSVLFLLCS